LIQNGTRPRNVKEGAYNMCVCGLVRTHLLGRTQWLGHNHLSSKEHKGPWWFLFLKTYTYYFRFGSVFIKKNNQTEIVFKKKNRNRTETGSNRPVSVRFGFLGQKPVQTGLPWFFRFGSVFSVFSVWLGFGSVFFGFGSVRFFAYKNETEPNRPVFLKF
jgi:hypothetical protein